MAVNKKSLKYLLLRKIAVISVSGGPAIIPPDLEATARRYEKQGLLELHLGGGSGNTQCAFLTAKGKEYLR